MKENKWNKFQKVYKNNLLILNIFFLFSFTFSFDPLFFSILFPLHFSQIFRNQHNQKVDTYYLTRLWTLVYKKFTCNE